MVLCTNYDFLEVMIKNLPSELKTVPFIIVIENRLQRSPSVERVKKLMHENNLKYRVEKATTITNWFVDCYTDGKNKFVENYTMGMNILAQAYFFKYYKLNGLLFVDDDVIFSSGTVEILKMKKSAFKYYRLSAGPADWESLSGKHAVTYNELAKVTSFKGTYKDYIDNHISSGNRFLYRDDFNVNEYIQRLQEFFKSKIFEHNWSVYKETGKGKMNAFYLDEKFETMAYHSMGILDFALEPYVVLETSKPEKLLKGKLLRRPIWHNATSSHKYETLEILRKKGEIS